MSVNIEFSNEQYLNLLAIFYLGIFVCDTVEFDEEIDDDSFIEANEFLDYEELEQYLLSFSKDAQLGDEYVQYDEVLGKYFQTNLFEEETGVLQAIEDYDDAIFWEELVFKLSRRDFILQYGEKNVQAMSLEEKIEKEQPFYERYSEEFFKHGIRNLQILKG
ncbi:MAG: hypothetical protein L6Q54_08710 [Leptospiraceae bacterium]|nr:hypothetical protein [Leptospiraceae bacterium]MCK6381315.1 hypothetical protein [Leptospiraceae bacterium]NUM40794.1 hypothetical protein [Leptospiraceae bacterium]